MIRVPEHDILTVLEQYEHMMNVPMPDISADAHLVDDRTRYNVCVSWLTSIGFTLDANLDVHRNTFAHPYLETKVSRSSLLSKIKRGQHMAIFAHFDKIQTELFQLALSMPYTLRSGTEVAESWAQFAKAHPWVR